MEVAHPALARGAVLAGPRLAEVHPHLAVMAGEALLAPALAKDRSVRYSRTFNFQYFNVLYKSTAKNKLYLVSKENMDWATFLLSAVQVICPIKNNFGAFPVYG